MDQRPLPTTDRLGTGESLDWGHRGIRRTLLGGAQGRRGPRKARESRPGRGAYLSAALDGDSDRCSCAEKTDVGRDGDAILYLRGCELKPAGRLVPRKIRR